MHAYEQSRICAFDRERLELANVQPFAQQRIERESCDSILLGRSFVHNTFGSVHRVDRMLPHLRVRNANKVCG